MYKRIEQKTKYTSLLFVLIAYHRCLDTVDSKTTTSSVCLSTATFFVCRSISEKKFVVKLSITSIAIHHRIHYEWVIPILIKHIYSIRYSRITSITRWIYAYASKEWLYWIGKLIHSRRHHDGTDAWTDECQTYHQLTMTIILFFVILELAEFYKTFHANRPNKAEMTMKVESVTPIGDFVIDRGSMKLHSEAFGEKNGK